jgi:hypothetical protein
MTHLSKRAPKKIGDGINEKKHINIRPNPIATVLSLSSTHLTYYHIYSSKIVRKPWIMKVLAHGN